MICEVSCLRPLSQAVRRRFVVTRRLRDFFAAFGQNRPARFPVPAGEFGHIVLQKDGPLCSCGKHGCLESLAAVLAILRAVQEGLASGEPSLLQNEIPLTLEAVIRAAEAEDALTLRVLDAAGRWLGTGIAGLVNVLNPELLVLNGEAVALGRAYLGPMEEALHRHIFDGLADSLRIIPEPGGNEMWARGAACVVLSSLFTSPVRQPGAQLMPAFPAPVNT